MTQSVMDRLLTAGLCGNTLGQDIQTLTKGRRKGGGGVRTILRAHDGRTLESCISARPRPGFDRPIFTS